MNPKCFVVEPYIPAGGTYMAYHLARLVEKEFGFEVIAVGEIDSDHGMFSYDPVFPRISVEDLVRACGDHDLLIANPSFSDLCLGLRCKGRKVMYAQGFNTYNFIDLHFDLYVAASRFVSRHLFSTYALDVPVINPFIEASRFPEPTPWAARPAGSTLIHLKGPPTHQALILGRLQQALGDRLAGAALLPKGLPHPEFVHRLGEARHLLSLSVAEGFGLVPLEAMAMGTAVLGFDAYGGRDYMKPGLNCAVRSYPDISGLVDDVRKALDDPARTETLAAVGLELGRSFRFSPARFVEDWRLILQEFL